MKNLITFLFLALQINYASSQQPPDTVKKYLVTGQLKFNYASSHGKHFTNHEGFTLTLRGVVGYFDIDNFTDNDLKLWLIRTGIRANDVLFTKTYGSSTNNAIELFYSVLMANPVEGRDIYLNNGEFVGDYEKKQCVKLTNMVYIIGEDVRQHIKYLCANYDIINYFVRSINIPEGPLLVLTRGVRDGYLMDMRYIAKSYRLVDYFKELNYYVIWYNDVRGLPVGITRPKTGWVIN